MNDKDKFEVVDRPRKHRYIYFLETRDKREYLIKI